MLVTMFLFEFGWRSLCLVPGRRVQHLSITHILASAGHTEHSQSHILSFSSMEATSVTVELDSFVLFSIICYHYLLKKKDILLFCLFSYFINRLKKICVKRKFFRKPELILNLFCSLGIVALSYNHT